MKLYSIDIKPGMVLTNKDSIDFIVIPIAGGIAFVNNFYGGIQTAIPQDIVCIRSMPINADPNSGKILWKSKEINNNIPLIRMPCIKCTKESFSIIEPILIKLGFERSNDYDDLSTDFNILIIDWNNKIGKYNFGSYVHVDIDRQLITNINEFLNCIKTIKLIK